MLAFGNKWSFLVCVLYECSVHRFRTAICFAVGCVRGSRELSHFFIVLLLFTLLLLMTIVEPLEFLNYLGRRKAADDVGQSHHCLNFWKNILYGLLKLFDYLLIH